MNLRASCTAAIAAILSISSSSFATEQNPCVPVYHKTGTTLYQHLTAQHVEVATQRGENLNSSIGFNTIGSLTLNCRSKSGCLLTVNSVVSVESQSFVCTSVDGAYLKRSAFITGGPVPTLQSAMLATGRHNLQTQIYVLNAGPLGPWDIVYSLYEP